MARGSAAKKSNVVSIGAGRTARQEVAMEDTAEVLKEYKDTLVSAVKAWAAAEAAQDPKTLEKALDTLTMNLETLFDECTDVHTKVCKALGMKDPWPCDDDD